MNRAFIWTMRHAPQLLLVAAILVYLSEVIIVVVAGQQMDALRMDATPFFSKAEAVVYMFVKPMVPALILLFGAAFLWRLDLYQPHLDRESEK
ncbi:MAG: hypothetical protein ABIS14_04485 [Sphingomonas sp.]